MPLDPSEVLHRRSAARRGFRAVDAVILAAAIAAGSALSFWVEALNVTTGAWTTTLHRGSPGFRPVVDPSSWRAAASDLSVSTLHVVMLSVPLLAALSVALLAIRLIPPRPRRRRLARQPGASAAFATVAALVAVGMAYRMVRLAHTRPDILHATKPNFLLTWDASWTLSCTPVLVGLSIVSSWTTLLVAGRWRPEASWIDRLGRVVAMGWLLAGLFTTCHQLVHRFLDTASSVIVWE